MPEHWIAEPRDRNAVGGSQPGGRARAALVAAVAMWTAGPAFAAGADATPTPRATPAVPGIVGDRLPQPLAGAGPGDVERGRRIVVERDRGACVLCHGVPDPQVRFHGDIAPPLDGVGARLDAAQLRLRIADSRVLNPATPMPAYARVDGLRRVAPAWRGRSILSAQEIEDVVAYLRTLR